MLRTSRFLPVLLLPLLLAAVATAGADTLLTIKSRTEGAPIMGRSPSQSAEVKIWVSPDDKRIRRDEGGYSMIMVLDKSKMYIVDHNAKTYNEIDLPVDFKKLMPQGGEQMMEEMQRMQKMEVAVKPSAETKKIGSWNTKRYEVTLTNAAGMKIASQMWMSQDVGFDTAAFSKLQASMTALSSSGTEWAKKMGEIPGFPVLTESRMTTPQGEIKTFQELQSVDKKPAPAGTYSVPSGYEKTGFGAVVPRSPVRPGPPRPAAPPPAAPKPAAPPPSGN
ncbi:MAG TPA: DUF4412 domain-containing protein [Thermoanaerobaculia bacterium]